MKKTWIVCGGIAILALAAGCDSSVQRQNGTLLSENETLKQQLATSSAALEQADREKQAAIARAQNAEAQSKTSIGDPATADAGAFAGCADAAGDAYYSDADYDADADDCDDEHD